MDPVLPPTMFDVLDQLTTKSAPLTIRALNDRSVRRHLTKRRFAEIGRVLEPLRVAHRDGESLVPGTDLKTFVAYWEAANLGGINDFFRRYQPYDVFWRYLRAARCIYVPHRTDTDGRRQMGSQLRKDKTGLTFVAIDTFKWWGMVVGQVYFSHIGDGNIYWGGERPNIDIFEKSVQSHYEKIRPLDGFANVGQLADRVCRELKIPFIRFERLFVELCLQRPGYVTATSLARTPTSKSTVQTLLPRSRAKRNGYSIEWTDKRFMEDGVFMNGRSVKMVKYHPLLMLTCH